MDHFNVGALIILAVFYTAYFTKMLAQKFQGIRTHQIGRGEKDNRTLMIEKIMGVATSSIVVAELYSIFRIAPVLTQPIFRYVGLAVAAAGVLLFVLSMLTMRDSWRAGISTDKTTLVTGGLYRISRNPAFLGFDFMYTGLLLTYFNPLHMLFAAFAVIMLHQQILQEEEHLIKIFGFQYVQYMTRTGRYLLFI